MLPPHDLEAARRFCEGRSPSGLRDEVRVELEEGRGALVVAERRAPWSADDAEWSSTPVARLRYTTTKKQWTLDCMRASGRWQRYDLIGPTPSVDPLLAEIDRDPTGIFWG
jgi:hypothetical protein